MMQIKKVINNNVVSSYDEQGREIIIMGKGLGFQMKPGQEIAEEKIEKIFRMNTPEESERFQNLIENLPMQHLQLSNEIIAFAKKELGLELNKNIYITLTDHISFAIERFQKDMLFQNALWREMRLYYPQEYRIGQYALDLIEKKVSIRFPEDEAASIAMHIINAEYNTNMQGNHKITSFIQESLTIISKTLNLEINERVAEHDGDIEKLIGSLKFLGLQLLQGVENYPDDEFYNIVEHTLKEEYQCCEKIADYAMKTYHCKMSKKGKTYLAIDIKRARGTKK